MPRSARQDRTDPVVARRLDDERQAGKDTEPEPEVANASVEGAETQAVEKEQAEAERQERERQDAEQAQAEQLEASRIEAERQGLERAETDAAEAADDSARKLAAEQEATRLSAQERMAAAQNAADQRLAAAEAKAKRVVADAENEAKRRIDEAQVEALRISTAARHEAQDRLTGAVAAARAAAEEKLAEAERKALEWVAAAEAEAERVATAHIVLGTQTAASLPITPPAPLVDEFFDAGPAANEPTQPDKARDSVKPEEVIDEPRALAAPKTKSVATKISVKTAGELAAEADRSEAERSSIDAPAQSTTMRPTGTPRPPRVKKERTPRPPKTPKPPRERSANPNRNWRLAAGIVGAVGLVFSVVLAAVALLIALGADQGSGIVGSIADLCNFLVGPLSDLFSFGGPNAETKQALVSWGLGSMIYLLVSRFIQSTLLRRVQDR